MPAGMTIRKQIAPLSMLVCNEYNISSNDSKVILHTIGMYWFHCNKIQDIMQKEHKKFGIWK